MASSGVPPIGARLRAERVRREISVRGLAREIGVSASLISQIETEKSSPSVSTLYAITTALGISIEDLFGDRAAGPAGGPRGEQFTAGGPRGEQFAAGGPRGEQFTAGGPRAEQFAAGGPRGEQFAAGGSRGEPLTAGKPGEPVPGDGPVPVLVGAGDPVVTSFGGGVGGLSTAFMTALAAANASDAGNAPATARAGNASDAGHAHDAAGAGTTGGAALADLAADPSVEAPRRLGPVVTPDLREILTLDSGVSWELLGRIPHTHLDFLLITYQPGGTSSSSGLLMRHSGLEFGYVVSGELTLTLGFDTHRLRAGDAVSFDSSSPHSYRNESTEPAVGVWFVLERST